ncbi:MAG: glycosyltransferase family 2 protein [Gallionella sp.]|nr:glycosyltransferase family 2 protein [Gallionella sp.]
MEEIVCIAQVSISIVSHGQAVLVDHLLRDIESNCRATSVELILTLNLDEPLPFAADSFSFAVKVIRNANPLGFAANHNQAFTHATGQYFCVMNPDIRFNSDPFQALIACLQDASVGVVAPLVVGESGEMEDSARRFPTPFKILCKLLGGCEGGDYEVSDQLVYPDWVGGMFMLFKRDIFKQLGGFDQRYFLYYEDVDLCARLRLLGYEVALCPAARVIHHAHRSSHRSFRYLRWHLNSMMRFFMSSAYWQVWFRK